MAFTGTNWIATPTTTATRIPILTTFIRRGCREANALAMTHLYQGRRRLSSLSGAAARGRSCPPSPSSSPRSPAREDATPRQGEEQRETNAGVVGPRPDVAGTAHLQRDLALSGLGVGLGLGAG